MHFKVKDSYIIADLAILFLAFTIFIFGWMSMDGILSERYVVAASISSFLFVSADWILLADRITGRRMAFHAMTFGLGIITLVLLPAILDVLPILNDELEELANVVTFYSLGLVLFLIGLKSVKEKINSRKAEKEARKEDTLEKEELKKLVEALENEINMYRREWR